MRRRLARVAGVWMALVGCAAGGDGPDEFGDRALSAAFMARAEGGAWWAPKLPDDPRDRMQAVHVALLPDGKVLVVNGSSNRNRVIGGEFLDGISPLEGPAVDNAALFDPTAPPDASGFERIASPPSPYPRGANPPPNDLFCSGHMQLADGSVLFAGGTKNYYPGEQFRGSRTSNVFDGATRSWEPAGLMHDGHWYPTLVPLPDRRVMVVSGLSADQPTNSSWIEFYDPTLPDKDARWSAVDVRTLPNSPFNTPVDPSDPLPATGSHGATPGPSPSMRMRARPRPATPGTALDEPDHYPRIAPLPDGRFLITGDGSGGGNVNSRRTYLMTVGPRPVAAGEAPAVRFELGPDRKALRKAFGTAFLDPAGVPGSYLLVGGMAGSGDINIGPLAPSPDPARINTVRSAERYTPPTPADPLGRWEVFPDFLGDRPTDRRMMHVGVLLPTGQVLLMGGGLYGTSLPVFAPLLLTPDPRAAGGYKVATMNPGQQPRLYHTSSLLLPDGRVLLAGGNATRAARDPRNGQVHLDTVRQADGTYAFNPAGANVVADEIYQVEVFYPPYLFAPGNRPRLADVPRSIGYGKPFSFRVEEATPGASMALIKLGSMTHAWDMGQRLARLAFAQSAEAGTATVQATAPDSAELYPPGHYMLFYVGGRGRPSKAAIVLLQQQ